MRSKKTSPKFYSLSSANHPDNWLTIARQLTVCLSECYDEKPDSLTVFQKFSLLLRIRGMGIHFVSFFIMAFPFLSFSFRFLFSYRLSSSFLEKLLHQRPAFLFEYSSDGCRFGMKYVRCEFVIASLFVWSSVYDAWYLCPSDGSGTHGTWFHGDVERAVGEIFASQGI